MRVIINNITRDVFVDEMKKIIIGGLKRMKEREEKRKYEGDEEEEKEEERKLKKEDKNKNEDNKIVHVVIRIFSDLQLDLYKKVEKSQKRSSDD